MPSWDHTFENWLWRGAVRGGDAPDSPLSGTTTPAVVFDMDGVLSDASRRQHFLEAPRRDWEAFFAACGEDELIAEVARLLDVIDDDHDIVLLTARPIRVMPQTLAWLDRYGLRWDLLIMRDFGDYTASPTFKRKSLGELRSREYDLRLGFEDDPRNVAMFHEEGVPCVYIHSGYHTT
ncbi:MAG: hypothetical protein M9942_07600 [Microthrixaceae bacterium]|nr:hypothetical protein [Microthrixaceae bacterium]MCO5318288.1 hypothetical protein [Microthrixaceae bacterium]